MNLSSGTVSLSCSEIKWELTTSDYDSGKPSLHTPISGQYEIFQFFLPSCNYRIRFSDNIVLQFVLIDIPLVPDELKKVLTYMSLTLLRTKCG